MKSCDEIRTGDQIRNLSIDVFFPWLIKSMSLVEKGVYCRIKTSANDSVFYDKHNLTIMLQFKWEKEWNKKKQKEHENCVENKRKFNRNLNLKVCMNQPNWADVLLQNLIHFIDYTIFHFH